MASSIDLVGLVLAIDGSGRLDVWLVHMLLSG